MTKRVSQVRRDKYLAGRSCEKCASPYYIQVTWKAPPGPFWTGYIWQFGDAKKRQGYLADCWVLCRNCKAREQGARLAKPHGTAKAGVSGCSCDVCKARRALTQREYRAQKKEREKR